MSDQRDPTEPVDPNAQDLGSEGGQGPADDGPFAQHAPDPLDELGPDVAEVGLDSSSPEVAGTDTPVSDDAAAPGEISPEELEMLQNAATELRDVVASTGVAVGVDGDAGESGETTDGDWSTAWAEAGMGTAAPLDASTPTLPEFYDVPTDVDPKRVTMLNDVKLRVRIELGRSRMLVEDVLKLGEGSVVELDKLAGDPVDVYVNDRLVARGEVLVLNDNFCVRVSDVISKDPHRVSV